MRKDIIILFLLFFSFGGLDFLGGIYSNEVFPGGELEIVVNVRNPTFSTHEDLRVRAIFFDLGDIIVSSEFELDDSETHATHLLLDLPKQIKRGPRLVKITVSNDDVYDSRFIVVNIR